MKSIFVVLAIVSSVIVGCGEAGGGFVVGKETKNNGIVIADENGTCSQAVLDVHNTIVSTQAVADRKAHCEKYKTMLGSFSCSAIRKETKESATLNIKSMDVYCEAKVENQPVSSPDSQPEKNTEAGKDSSSNAATEKPELCTPEMLIEMSMITQYAEKYKTAPQNSDLIVLVESCKRLKKVAVAGMCYKDEAQPSISYEKQYGMICTDAEASLVKTKPGATPTPTAIIGQPPVKLEQPSPNSAAGQKTVIPQVSAMPKDSIAAKSSITLLALQPASLTTKLKAEESIFIQKGKLFSSANQLQEGPACVVMASNEFKGFVAKKEVVFSNINHRSGNYSGETQFVNLENGLEFKCFSVSVENADVNYKMTVDEFRVLTGNWLKVVKAESSVP